MKRLTPYPHHRLYKTSAGERLLDLARQQFVMPNPEEYVRQDVLRTLNEKYGYPRKSLYSEEPVVRDGSSRHRADVIVKLPHVLKSVSVIEPAKSEKGDPHAKHPSYSDHVRALNGILKGLPGVAFVEVPDYLTLAIDGSELRCRVLGFSSCSGGHQIVLLPSDKDRTDLCLPQTICLQVNGYGQEEEESALSQALGIPQCKWDEPHSSELREAFDDLLDESVFPDDIGYFEQEGFSVNGSTGWKVLFGIESAGKYGVLTSLDITPLMELIPDWEGEAGEESPDTDIKQKPGREIDEEQDDTSEGSTRPFIVVECKAPGIDIRLEEIREKGLEYARECGSQFLVLTNGKEAHSYHLRKGRPERIGEIPSYEQAISGETYRVTRVEPDEQHLPIPNNVSKESLLLLVHERSRCLLGSDTPRSLWRPILALDDLLHKPSVLFEKPCKSFGVTFLADKGVFCHEAKNPSGSGLGGQYRDLLIQLEDGKEVIVGFCVVGQAMFVNSTRYGNRRSGTHLVGIVSRDSECLSGLELRFERGMSLVGGKFEMTHNGVISRQPSALLKAYLRERRPDLMADDDRIYLGSIPDKVPLTWEDVRDFLGRFAVYTVLREEYKEKVRASRGQAEERASPVS